MRLGILATNIRSGGGVSHLTRILAHSRPEEHGFREITVWTGSPVASRLPERPWLRVVRLQEFDRSLFHRLWWEFRHFPALVAEQCDVLFAPAGTYIGSYRPLGAKSQNLLPFDRREIRRFGLSASGLKFHLIRLAQKRCFQQADGVLFLQDYSRKVVLEQLSGFQGATEVVPYGLDPRFRTGPRPHRSPSSFSENAPFEILYLSTVNAYKHQWLTVEAAHLLRERGHHVRLRLVGGGSRRSLRRLRAAIERFDPTGTLVSYEGDLPYGEIHDVYGRADCFLFASTCESISQILLEAMGAGLPIACSNVRPMPDVLDGAGVFFRPEDTAEMAAALESLLLDVELRTRLGEAALARSLDFDWQEAADATLAFLARIARPEPGNR